MSEKIYSPIIYDPISKIYYKQELNTHTGIVLNPQQQFINKLIKQRDQYKTERDTLIDDIAVLKANISRLEWTLKNKEDEIDWRDSKLDRLQNENKRLTRLTHKLTTHRTMWDNLKDWRRDMLEIDKNDTQLIGLGLVMDDLEKRHLYKEDE